jgi:polyphenol oxidase
VAYSSVADGDMRSKESRTRFLASLGCTLPHSIPRHDHGPVVSVVTSDVLPDAPAPPGDGLVTSDTGRALGALGADCSGLVLCAPDALGVAHCGWRGTAAGIVPALVAAVGGISAYPPASWHAFVGPGISPEGYEVDEPVLSARVWPAHALTPTRPGHARLDVGGTVAEDCRAAGVGTVQQCAGVHTDTDPRLWSFRKSGRGINQVLVAWREPELGASH